MISFKLDTKAGMPFYRQIIDQIRFGIANGRLQPGEQLPTVRSLAVQLQVNLNTVAKAYKELEILGILETQQGSGTFISGTDVRISNSEIDRKLEDICNEFTSIALSYGFSAENIVKELQKRKKNEDRQTQGNY